MGHTILRCENIKMSFGKLEVLKGISLEIGRGEVVAVIGPSGSGKSTLLRCLNRLERIGGGLIEIDGEQMAHMQGGRLVYAHENRVREMRRKMGMVFQSFNLFPHLSALQNITEAPIHVQGKSKEEADAKAKELLGKVGLSDKAAAYPCELSGGQKQRVAIARALALDPQILFFDEPTSALDPQLTAEVLLVMKQLAMEGMTMLVVTHEMGFAKEVAHSVVFMEDGLIREQGPPQKVLTNPESDRLRAFLGI